MSTIKLFQSKLNSIIDNNSSDTVKNKEIEELLFFNFVNLYQSNKKDFLKIVDITHRKAEEHPEIYSNYKKCKEIFNKFKEETKNSKSDKELHNILKNEILFLTDPKKHVQCLKTEAEIRANGYFDSLEPELAFQQLFGLSCASTLKIGSESALSVAGSPIFSSSHELRYIKNFLKANIITSDELPLVKSYYEGIERSFGLNKILNFLTERKTSKIEWSAAYLIHQDVMKLNEGESYHLDFGIKNHAYRMQIERIKDKLQLTLFDTSGELEPSQKEFSLSNVLKTSHKSATALSFQVPLVEMQKKGQTYFLELLLHNSKEAYESSKGFEQDTKDFLKSFKALGEKFTLSNIQTTQKAGNCSMQRIRADQKKNFGTELYRKFRKFTIESVKEEYLKMSQLNKHEIEDLQKLPIKAMSKDELKKARKFFMKLGTLPKNYQEWEQVFRVLNHNIARYSSSV